MRRLPLLSLSVLAVAASSGAVAACSSSSSSPAEQAPDSGTPQPDAGTDSAPGTLTVSPTTANVLTCSTLQFTETGGVGDGGWSVAPATASGTIASSGDYTAPLVAPTAPAVTITYATATASASAQIQVATAFVGAAAAVPITATDNSLNVPFEHQFAANGSHVYAGVMAQTSSSSPLLEADIFRSTDDGKTFTGPVAYHTGNLSCATVAVDSGNADVVYLAYLAGHGDSTSNTGQTLRLAVSSDGAQTFPVEYDLADSVNSIAPLICPDVTSPSAGHVIVAGVVTDATTAHVATFVSTNQGAGIGPVSQEGTAGTVNPDGGALAPSDTNGASATTCNILSNGGGGSPRVFGNGAGAACIAFRYNSFSGCSLPNDIAVQCSQDNGATWTSPVSLGNPTANVGYYPTGSISPSGKVAITWLDTVQGGSGSDIVAYVAFSTDHGATFGMPVQYPAASSDAHGGTAYPVVAWENDSVLWLGLTGTVNNVGSLYVDKTCDDGVSWSGAVTVGSYLGSSLILTSGGMAAAGDVGSGSQAGASISLLPLAAP